MQHVEETVKGGEWEFRTDVLLVSAAVRHGCRSGRLRIETHVEKDRGLRNEEGTRSYCTPVKVEVKLKVKVQGTRRIPSISYLRSCTAQKLDAPHAETGATVAMASTGMRLSC
ncbi:hypothetical protein ACLOJK_016195 [Asimina triloba]